MAWGTEDQIRDRIQQQFDAGATQVILNTIHPGGPADSKTDVGGYNFQSAPHWEAYELLKPG